MIRLLCSVLAERDAKRDAKRTSEILGAMATCMQELRACQADLKDSQERARTERQAKSAAQKDLRDSKAKARVLDQQLQRTQQRLGGPGVPPSDDFQGRSGVTRGEPSGSGSRAGSPQKKWRYIPGGPGGGGGYVEHDGSANE